MISARILDLCQVEELSIGDAIRDCNISDDYVNTMRKRMIFDCDPIYMAQDIWAEYPDNNY